MTRINSSSWTGRLVELGITLPPVVPPVAAYRPAVQSGTFVYTAGQLPLIDGKLTAEGKVGADVTPEAAAAAAETAALNALAAIDSVAGIDSVVRIVKVTGFVNSAPGFTGQPAVIDGASNLFEAVFGEAGAHARSAVGVAELPRGAAVEVEVIAEVVVDTAEADHEDSRS